MKTFLLALALAVVGSGSGMADVVNGSFESGTPNDGAGTHWTRLVPGDPSLTGWTVVSGNVDWFSAQVAPACAGNRSLELNGNINGAVSQTFATKPGVAYRVTFCMAANPNGPPAVKTLLVGVDSNQYMNYEFDATGHTLTDMGWQTRTFTFTATGASTQLRFESRTTRDDGGLNAYGPVIDNVVVVEDSATRTLTDQWWIEAESGWGASVLQQRDTLFVCFFVYGPDNKPTWFVAVATYQSGSPSGRQVYAGELWVTTGPWYGGDFNTALRTDRKAGTFTFDVGGGSASSNTATMTYTVDGTTVQENVTRQTWAYENIGGSYYGGLVWDEACGPAGREKDHFEILGSMQIAHAPDNTVRIDWQPTSVISNGVAQPVPGNASMVYSGPYAQSGHMGQVKGILTYTFGEDAGTIPWNLFDIERTINGIMGRLDGIGQDAEACHYDGRLGGVRR